METEILILEYLKVLTWPITVLLILFVFRKKVFELLGRARRLELPGGISLEVFEKKIQEAKDLALKVEHEERPELEHENIERQIREVKTEPEINKRMIELGLKPSPSGLQISYYQDLAEVNSSLAFAALRIDLELMLKNLAKGFKIEISERESISKINRELKNHGAITNNQYKLINKLLQITNAAVHGIDVNIDQATDVFEIMEILINDYKAWLSWGFKNQ